jgi:hypothetical protein
VVGLGFGRGLMDFREFIAQPLFRLGIYKVSEGNYCVGLLVKCEDPGGWIAIWRRCYDNIEDAILLLENIERTARNRLGDLLFAVEVRLGEEVKRLQL